jgi:hypothetical protein
MAVSNEGRFCLWGENLRPKLILYHQFQDLVFDCHGRRELELPSKSMRLHCGLLCVRRRRERRKPEVHAAMLPPRRRTQLILLSILVPAVGTGAAAEGNGD